MRMNLKNLLWLFAAAICFASCSKEDIIEKVAEIPEGKILVGTEIVIDGVDQSDTRAVSEAGYTTGDGLYDKKDKVTVAAFANEGYELVTFYDKKDPNINLGASYTLTVQEPRTFKAEFARKYTITVSANPTAGGTVAGGGTYRGGKTCTLTATANAGYVFDGWYEGSTKVSSDTNYSFIVSSNRTIIGKFELLSVTFGCITGQYGNHYYFTIDRTLPFDVTISAGIEGWSEDQSGNMHEENVGGVVILKAGSLKSELLDLNTYFNETKADISIYINNKIVIAWDTTTPKSSFPLSINYSYENKIYRLVFPDIWG